MKHINKWSVAVWSAFIAAELAIYITFLCYDLAGGLNTTFIKYSGVLLCVAAAAVSAIFYGSDGILLTVALVFTAVSDLFILVLNDYYEVGLCTFIVVQTAYFIRIYIQNGKKPYISAAVRAALIVAVIITLACTNSLMPLTCLVAVYIVFLLVNCVEAFVFCGKDIKKWLFAIGLLLFLCCDICVGLNNFRSVLNISLPAGLISFVSIGMWAFYLPSQVLIVFSVRKRRNKNEE